MTLPEVLLVTSPSCNFGDFLNVCQTVLGYAPSRAVDASRRDLSDPEKFMSCLAAFRDKEARVGYATNPNFLSHVSFSVLVVARERDLLDMLERCAGMPFVTAETLDRSVLAAVITGTLAQWRDAVVAGSVPEVELSVRVGFNKLYRLFHGAKLNVWSNYRIHEAPDKTILIEQKAR